jgi:hypothetical protein
MLGKHGVASLNCNIDDILMSRAAGILAIYARPPPADHHIRGEFIRWKLSGIVQTMPFFFVWQALQAFYALPLRGIVCLP